VSKGVKTMQVNEVVNRVLETNMPTSGLKQEEARSPTLPSEEKGENSLNLEKGLLKPEEAHKVNEMVGMIQEELEKLDVRLVFNVDEKTKDVVVKIVDPKTNEVIRQIPPEELLKVREKLDELVGILFEARA